MEIDLVPSSGRWCGVVVEKGALELGHSRLKTAALPNAMTYSPSAKSTQRTRSQEIKEKK